MIRALEFLKLNISKKLLFLVSLALLSCTLITTELFVFSSLFHYYSIVLFGSIIFILFLLSVLFKSEPMSRIKLPFSFILFLAWVFYVFINYQDYNNSVNYRIAIGLLFTTSFFFLKSKNVGYFYQSIAIISAIESLWCFLQWFGYIESESPYFEVTGSFSNPNIIAMFLAISIPAILYLISKSKRVFKLLYIVEIIALVAAILLLECRTAIIGSFLAFSIFACLHYRVFSRFQKRHILLTVLIISIISIPIGRQLYLLKKDSADGRKLIWSTSLDMIKDSPLRGHGVGMFSKEYNLKQAELIEENHLNENEIKNASFIKTAYNDYLEQGVEGGIPGAVLFSLMILSLLILVPKKSKGVDPYNAAYSAIAACSVMMLFNFVVNSMAVMLLFSLYAGILCNSTAYRRFIKLGIKRVYMIPSIILLMVFVGAFISVQLNFALAHVQFKKAQGLVKEGNIYEAEKRFSILNETLQSSTSFLMNYGNVYFLQKEYEKSLEKFDTAKMYSSNPQIYDMIAKCHFHMKDYKSAIYNMDMASRLHPKKMEYKYGVLRLLHMDNQINKAEEVALSIINMKPSETNEMTEKFQGEAKLFLERSHNNNKLTED